MIKSSAYQLLTGQRFCKRTRATIFMTSLQRLYNVSNVFTTSLQRLSSFDTITDTTLVFRPRLRFREPKPRRILYSENMSFFTFPLCDFLIRLCLFQTTFLDITSCFFRGFSFFLNLLVLLRICWRNGSATILWKIIQEI